MKQTRKIESQIWNMSNKANFAFHHHEHTHIWAKFIMRLCLKSTATASSSSSLLFFWQHPSVNNQTEIVERWAAFFPSSPFSVCLSLLFYFYFYFFSLSLTSLSLFSSSSSSSSLSIFSLTAWLSLLKKERISTSLHHFFPSSFDVSYSLLVGCLFNNWYFPCQSLQSCKYNHHRFYSTYSTLSKR